MSELEFALGTQCGVTFAGIKAASLFSVKKCCLDCLNRYEEYFANRGFTFMAMRENGERVLLYVYNRSKLEKILFDYDNRKFLEGEGYFYETADGALAVLKERMSCGDFPHEIGIFLNYPLEDVKGFIADPVEGVKYVGYWKVYGDEERKKQIFDTYERCTRRIKERLLSGIPLEAIFCKTNYGNTAAL